MVPEPAWQPQIFDRTQADDAARLDNLMSGGQVYQV
jgi:hypothetical protein